MQRLGDIPKQGRLSASKPHPFAYVCDGIRAELQEQINLPMAQVGV